MLRWLLFSLNFDDAIIVIYPHVVVFINTTHSNHSQNARFIAAGDTAGFVSVINALNLTVYRSL